MKGIKVSGPWEVVLVAAVCICAFFINNQVITPDIMESRNIIAAREMVYDGHWITPTMNGDLRLENLRCPRGSRPWPRLPRPTTSRCNAPWPVWPP